MSWPRRLLALLLVTSAACGDDSSNEGVFDAALDASSTTPDAALEGGSAPQDAAPDAPLASDAGDAGSPDAAPAALDKFSFFVASQTAMLALARDGGAGESGFGGDLRFGETGEGAGLRGADKICRTIAEGSMPGASVKGWRAFLSTRSVHAKDRIGAGPWYDRRGRLVAANLGDLLAERPVGADPVIADDLPNESGTPNQYASGVKADNHDILTGSNKDGVYVRGEETCGDWTSTSSPSGFGPQVGHSWCAASDTCGGGAATGRSWIAAHFAFGCGASVNTQQNGGGSDDDGVGDSGGYGGIYCFALTP